MIASLTVFWVEFSHKYNKCNPPQIAKKTNEPTKNRGYHKFKEIKVRVKKIGGDFSSNLLTLRDYG